MFEFDNPDSLLNLSTVRQLGRDFESFAHGAFCLFFQPQLDLRENRATGMEALLRWRHPDRGILLPWDFHALLDDVGTAERIDLWVLHEAVRQMAAWRAVGVRVPVSVNISARSLQRSNLSAYIGALVDAYPDVSAADLELEVRERALIEQMPDLLRQLRACTEQGIRFAIDGFGTRFARFTYLSGLPPVRLKIDRRFVGRMLEHPDERAIVRSILAMADAFRWPVVAVGAETLAHVAQLTRLGCEIAQGFAIARPMPAGKVRAWMSDGKG
jgi:EAL domain-containing protein (putative c-di-GMP-specific phosphodiesterase class I)